MFAHNIVIENAGQRVTVTYNDEVIAQTQRALKLHEPPLLPVCYIPRDDVRMELLSSSKHKTTCPYKGEASYFDMDIGGEHFENAAWSYESPKDDVAEIKGFIAFFTSVVTINED